MKVLCVGEMLIDLIVPPVEQVSFRNDTLQIGDIRMTSGGDANNNAINFAKLGHQVIYLGRIGCDDLGDYVVALARSAGIDMDHVARSATAGQGKSLILINPAGDRTFLQYPGVSAEFCFEDCDLSMLAEADLLQISGAYHLPKFDGQGAGRLLKAAKEHSVTTSMDVTSDRTGCWRDILTPCYPYLDYFLPSIEQATMITGLEEPRQIADFFLDRGVKNVAIKLGSRGSYFKNAKSAFYAGVYADLQIVETTGAGDAFCAGFLTGAGEQLPPDGCITLGTACSSLVIQAAGATAGMQDLAAVRQFIQARPPLEIRRDV